MLLLAFSRFRGSHTAEAISEQFDITLASFDISNKISHIITDNASNMSKAFTFPGFEDMETVDSVSSSPTSGHESDGDTEMIASEVTNISINMFHALLIRSSWSSKMAANINKFPGKASSIVAHVRKSHHALELLESEKCLQAANATRWNSQLTMIRFSANITNDKLRSMDTQYQITTYDRNILKDLADILTPFESATI